MSGAQAGTEEAARTEEAAGTSEAAATAETARMAVAAGAPAATEPSPMTGGDGAEEGEAVLDEARDSQPSGGG